MQHRFISSGAGDGKGNGMKKRFCFLLGTIVLISLLIFTKSNGLASSYCIPFSALDEQGASNETDAFPVLDLSGIPMENTVLLEKLLPEISSPRKILLYDCGLSDPQIMAMADHWRNFEFVWNMRFGGKSFSTDSEEIDLTGVPLKSTHALELRLKYLPNVKKIILSDCGLDSPTLDALNRRYQDIRFVWTVKLGRLSVRTDETWFMPVKFKARVETKDLAEFKYCTDMICIDIGHMWVDNCDWAAYMPNLEYLIIGETKISDLSPLKELKKLKYLELFTIPVKDYSPLLGCTGLEDLNLGLTYGDPDIIAQMTWLKNLWWCDANGVHDPQRREAVTRMCSELSDTNIAIYIDHPTASGWRKLPNYYKMRDILGMFYMD